MISVTPFSICRFWSVSSMRRKNTPPRLLVKLLFSRAVYSPPICMKPVGLGAKRVHTAPSGRFLGGYRASASWYVILISGKSASATRLLM